MRNVYLRSDKVHYLCVISIYEVSDENGLINSRVSPNDAITNFNNFLPKQRKMYADVFLLVRTMQSSNRIETL